MKTLLKLFASLLLFAAPTLAATNVNLEMPHPNIGMRSLPEEMPAPDPPQTHTFCAQDLPCAFTGTLSSAGPTTITGLLTCKNLEGFLCVDSTNTQGWAGTDIGGWINAAGAAAVASGSKVVLGATNGCVNYSTPITFTTISQANVLEGNGQCLNFTPTGGSSAAITAITEATNTVTATSTLNPGTNNYVCVTGYPEPFAGYNGCYQAASSSSSQFTYVDAIQGLGSGGSGSGAGLATNVPAADVAFTLDYNPSTGANAPWSGVKDLYLRNALCVTTGGCGNGTIGLLIGATNAGVGQGASLERLRIEGFGVAEVINSGTSFAINHLNVWYWRSGMGVNSVSPEEGINWQGGGAEFNGHGVMLNTPSTAGFDRFHFDSNVITALSAVNGNVGLNTPWFENLTGTGTITTAATTGVSETGNTVTVSTSSACNLVPYQPVTIASTTNASFNGNWTVLPPGCNGGSTFQYLDTSTGLGSSSGSTFSACNGYLTHFFNGTANFQSYGGGAQDDCATGAADYWFTANASEDIEGMSVNSAGRTAGAATLLVANTSGYAHFINLTPGTLSSICPVGPSVTCLTTGLGGYSQALLGLYSPRIVLTNAGFTGYNVVSASGATGIATYPSLTGTVALSGANQTVTEAQFIANQGSACTNGELALSAGWQSTGSATVTAVAGTGQTCSWTITTGTTTAANPTVTDTLTNALPTATTVCLMTVNGGTHTPSVGAGTSDSFRQTTLSATAPVFTYNETPTPAGTTYFVTRTCGP